MSYNKPPYQITSDILSWLTKVSEQIGAVNALHLNRPQTELRKANRIKTIQSTLAIEGNTLSEEQITALLNNKRILAPQKDILEVQNAIATYNKLHEFKPFQLKSLLDAHKSIMQGLIKEAGSLRKGNVGIVKGSEVTHLAPPGNMVPHLLKDLLDYVKNDKDPILIKTCVFHYEFEFIHPFADGNGRMGRLWQTILLMRTYPVFEYLPIESIIKAEQASYYEALSKSDKQGHSTLFITYMLESISKALEELLDRPAVDPGPESRISLFREFIGTITFTRKDYLKHFKSLSMATASRDLRVAVEMGIVERSGDKNTSTYRYKDIS
ncbi:Fic family protein [Pedobacter sp. JY14-1]|uniref:Fic family protein n=1 Tax=Pedobacter sp. JY14-1 TaxID=3034151 RepID=UPI0023E223B8|nr:Fic family protein [Pedobacter sp. JY14-1]